MESNPPIAPPVEVVIKGIETETHIRPVTRSSSKLRPRRSHSSSSLATVSPRRGGDAVGQPRKTRQLVESTTEAGQEMFMRGQSDLLSCSPPVICEVAYEVSIDQKENEFYPSTVPSLGSIRGTKRSASRPSSEHEHSNPLPRVSLNVPPSSLSRSNSNVSIDSEGSVDERPPKRRTENSNAKKVKTITPASRKLERGGTKRGMLTPPRITEMWGQLSRIGSSPPGDKEKS